MYCLEHRPHSHDYSIQHSEIYCLEHRPQSHEYSVQYIEIYPLNTNVRI
jgi:hypothetical protein